MQIGFWFKIVRFSSLSCTTNCFCFSHSQQRETCGLFFFVKINCNRLVFRSSAILRMSNRIDAHVAFQLNCSKSKAQQLIKSNNVLVNDKLATKASYKVILIFLINQ